MQLGCRELFRFFLPPVIEFGCGARTRISDYARNLGITRALLLLDPFFVETDFYQEARENLETASIAATPWTGVVPNPTDVSIDEAATAYDADSCDGIIAIGGGSALDTAKGVAIVAESGGNARDYTPEIWKPVEGMAPTILLPTTAGTGAEVNPWSMVTNTTTGKKGVGFNAGDLVDAQKVAIVDPELTVTMPPRLTTKTGIDAFAHAVECYLSHAPNPISDLLALKAIELVQGNLREAVYDGGDMAARAGMSLAATLATTAFPNADLIYPHYLSAQLYDRWGLDHGITVAITLEASLEALLPAKTGRLAEIARVFGVVPDGRSQRKLAEAGIEAVSQMLEDLDIPSFKEVTGATEDDVDELIEGLGGDVPDKWHSHMRCILTRCLED